MKLYRYYLRLFASGLRGGGAFRAKRLPVPTLLLFGAADRYVSTKLLPGYEAHADEMEVELVPDSGHFLVNEKPDLVARRALAFLS
jgi:pimeloyl-ACP methyl ester carboxylesterase